MDNKVKDITIVSLSRGLLGEPFIKHERDIGLKRLEAYGINVHFSKHALSGLEYVAAHPEDRAADLLEALSGDTDMILCAVGGDDTYRLLPYLFDDGELQKAAALAQGKIFLGFSDTTVNHFMLNKVGMKTFYGQAFLPDVCELDTEMLPYTRHYFEELISSGRIEEIKPSDIWYEERQNFDESAVGTAMTVHKNAGFELLQGVPVFSGRILGGCIDTIFDIFDGERYADSPALCEKYSLFPSRSEWEGKLLLLESSEERPTPEKYRRMLQALKATGIFGVINGILIGKPADEKYFSEYKRILVEEIADPELPVVVNVSVGHATPRCIIPFGVKAVVNVNEQRISFIEDTE